MAMQESTASLLSVPAAIRRPRANTIAETQPASRNMDKNARDCCSSGSFVTKLYKMVDSEPATIVSWIRGGTAFCIVDPKMMAEHCLPKYFRHRRFSSLIRQLNFYSFYRVQEGQLTIYQHSFFRKGRPDLLVHIKRRGAGKAKDPWFDPLHHGQGASNNNKPPVPTSMTNSNLMMMGKSNNSMDTNQTNQFAPQQAARASNGMLCYSPMAKPLASSIDNMSPALKPGMAHMAPPVVDLDLDLSGGGSSSTSAMGDGDKYMENQRWENQIVDLQMHPQHQQHNHNHHQQQHKADFTGLPIKNENTFGTELLMAGAAGSSSSSVMLKQQQQQQLAVDMDIQDFLTDDCIINAVLSGKGGGGVAVDDRMGLASSSSFLGNGIVPAKQRAQLAAARDCLKWGESTKDAQRSGGPQHHQQGDVDDAAFEQELLLDLANVEPGAWEMPLSPLNEEEDVMPWLDLCF